ncbi:hypothetical protein OEV98_06300 [Caldibacillus lycopersici]|uniref:Uncharacterized protein n=1 Tax=Perspicuibacillus lycopersici TaxID=1325689 RepID=A0AAE3ITG6_9BACI|nr:hypothetical protein [Perspicuibacillus lycopersici]MCU9613161.1 hypothetical protein [Perspicuibacillus lycopersici]
MLYIVLAFIALWILSAFFSYYLFYLIVVSVCSIGILTIFFWKIVWDGLYTQYRLRTDPDFQKNMEKRNERKRREKEKKLRKLSPFQQWKTKVSEKLGSFFSLVLLLGIFLGIPAGALAIGGSFLLDFPSYLFGKTNTITGYVTDYENVSGNKSLSYVLVEIENTDYVLTKPAEFYLGDKVTIDYLPHTKIIRDFEIVEDRITETTIAPVDPSVIDNPLAGSWEFSDENVYISLLLSESGSANWSKITGDDSEGTFYYGNWKYDETNKSITINVTSAEDHSWQPVEYPEEIDIQVATFTEDTLEVEIDGEKFSLTRMW